MNGKKPLSGKEEIVRELISLSGKTLAIAAQIAGAENYVYGEFTHPDGTIWDLTFKKR